eukprot:1160662-Pelagomonas_calceolata.AAC.4
MLCCELLCCAVLREAATPALQLALAMACKSWWLPVLPVAGWVLACAGMITCAACSRMGAGFDWNQAMAKARSEAVLDVIEAELKVAGEGRKGLGSCEHLQGRCLNSKRACYQICPVYKASPCT